MIKNIIFDMDGTLIDSNDLVIKIYESLVEKYPSIKDLNEIPKPELLAKGYPEILEILYGTIRLDLIPIIYDIHEYLSLNYIKAYPKTIETLKYLKNNNFKIFLVTSELRHITINELRDLNILNYFDEIVAFEDVTNPKPNPEGINKIITKYNLNTNETIFVGDSISDAKAAKLANIKSIYMNWHNDESRISAFYYTFNNFDDLLKYINI